MPSSFARRAEIKSKFDELITFLQEVRPEGKGQPADRWDDLIARLESLRNEVETLGNPQSGSSG